MQVQELQLLLATSRSSLDETQKELNALSHKHREMEKQYDKKFQEKESQLQQMKAENQRLEKECEMRQILAEKQKELQQSQAQIQQAEMANELTRLQRARNREDEFSKAFQEEFAAHHAMKARYAELQNQLDSVLDSLDVSVHCSRYEVMCMSTTDCVCTGHEAEAGSVDTHTCGAWSGTPLCGTSG